MARLAAVKRSPSDRGRLDVGIPPTRDHQAMTDDEVLNEARADGFELVERLAAVLPWAACPTRAHLARSRARRAAELSLSGGRELSKSERLNGLRDPVLKLRDRSSEVRSFSVRLQRIRISVSLFFPRCCSEAPTRSRANASARTTFGRGRPLAGPEEERTSPCPADCPSGRDETRPNSRQNVDARSLRRQPQLGHVIGDAATQPNGNDVECTCRD